MFVHVLSILPVILMSHVSRIIEPTAKSGSFHGQSTHHLKKSREWVIHYLNGMSSFSLKWGHNFKLNIYSRHYWQKKANILSGVLSSELSLKRMVTHADVYSIIIKRIFQTSIVTSLMKSIAKSARRSLHVIVLLPPAYTCPLAVPKPVLVSPCFHIEGHTAATPGQNTTCTWKMINKSQMWKMRNVISPSLDPQSPLESRWSVISHLWSSFRIPLGRKRSHRREQPTSWAVP